MSTLTPGTKPTVTTEERIPTHRCKVCGCLWILYPANPWAPKDNPGYNGWWSLGTNEVCGPCCDNVAMGDQIETLADAYKAMRRRAHFPAQRVDAASWVLLLLVNDEISAAKAREWLRHYIQDGVEDPLPAVEALP